MSGVEPLRWHGLAKAEQLSGIRRSIEEWTERAGLGVDPWTVFAEGVSLHTGIGIGWMTSIIGFLVLLLWIPLRQKPGAGTIANIVLVGTSMQVALGIIPRLSGPALQFGALIAEDRRGHWICRQHHAREVAQHEGVRTVERRIVEGQRIVRRGRCDPGHRRCSVIDHRFSHVGLIH